MATESIKETESERKDSGRSDGSYFTPVAFLLIIATTALVYSNSLSGPFVIDDFPYILYNAAVRDLGAFTDALPLGTRYVTFLSFALNYAVGGYSELGFHLTNVVIHLVNGLLVWTLVKAIFATPVMKRCSQRGATRDQCDFIALAAALIFVCHPIQTQAVTYISQRLTSLAALFYLSSLVMYIKWRVNSIDAAGDKTNKGAGRGQGLGGLYYVVSLVLAVIAMKTKEIAFTLPVVIVLFELALFKPAGSGGPSGWRRLAPIVPFLLTMAIIPAELFIFASDDSIHSSVGEQLRWMQLYDITSISPYAYLLTQFRVIVTYLRLLVFPAGQHMLYDYPLYESLFEPAVLLSLLFLLTIICLSLSVFVRSVRGRNALGAIGIVGSLGVVWFFITLSVESSVIPIKHLIAEHRLYLPSVGAATAFAALLYAAFEKPSGGRFNKTVRWVVLFVIVTALGAATLARNRVWGDDVRLWEDEAAKSPAMAEVHNALGVAYQRAGRIEAAAASYEKALGLDPENAENHNNLGNLFFKLGRYGIATKHYGLAIRYDGFMMEPRSNLASAFLKLGRIDEAIAEYKQALLIAPSSSRVHYNLGLAYMEKGLYSEAASEFVTTIELDPGSERARRRLRELSGKR